MLKITKKIVSSRVVKKQVDSPLVGTTHKLYDAVKECAVNVTINTSDGRPLEVFVNSKHQDEWTIAVGRLVSFMLKKGVDKEEIGDCLSDIEAPGGGTFYGKQWMPSTAAHIGALISGLKVLEHVNECPECGTVMVGEGGCLKCLVCGLSKCE